MDATAQWYKAVENLYHRYLTRLVLRAVLTRGQAKRQCLCFASFADNNKQPCAGSREAEPLGLPRRRGVCAIPLSVECLRQRSQYGYENDQQAWVRYPPPRWIWDATTTRSIPSQVLRAMMRGWHARNGALLGNPRLDFVCTMQTTDGQPGLEGHFYEYNQDLEPNARLHFAPEEESPAFDTGGVPTLGRTA